MANLLRSLDLASDKVHKPEHLVEYIWLAIPKEQGVDSIDRERDLEFPIEDA